MIQQERVNKYFLKNDIQAVIFDVDATLLDTYNWLGEKYTIYANEICNYINSKYLLKINAEEFKTIFFKKENEHYKNGAVSFTSRFSSTIKSVIDELEIDIDLEDLIKKFAHLPTEIYNSSPFEFPDTTKVLNILTKVPSLKSISVCTHSGEEWTKIKVNYIKELYQKDFNEDIDLSYHSIDIEKEKNSHEWALAASKIGIDVKNILTVGDHFEVDILAPYEAGYRHFVWITKNEDAQNIASQINSEVKIVDNISRIPSVLH